MLRPGGSFERTTSIVGFALKIPDCIHSFMYLIVIAWIYVVLMMSVAEATNSTGTVLGAVMTFVLYGVGPVALVVYLMGAPARSKALKKRAALEQVQRTEAKPALKEAPPSPPHAQGTEPPGRQP
jgi:hypothetical protein